MVDSTLFDGKSKAEIRLSPRKSFGRDLWVKMADFIICLGRLVFEGLPCSEDAALKSQAYALHWFRRDLRVAGNEALHRLRQDFDGRVVGVFCFDKKFLARPDFSYNRFQFFLKTLASLKDELKAIGSDLIFMDRSPDEGFETLFATLRTKKVALPKSVGWNRDYEPYARKRDERMQLWFQAQGVHTLSERDHILIEPHEIVKSTKPLGPYQIFTPYSRKWRESFETEEVQRRVAFQAEGLKYLRALRKGKVPKLFHLRWADLVGEGEDGWAVFDQYLVANSRMVNVPVPEAGSLAALKRVEEFSRAIVDFESARDIPSMDGTSRFSIFLKNGSLTTAQAIAALDLCSGRKLSSGELKFFSELIWREFGYYILQKHPRVETEAFDQRFQNVTWTNNEKWFQAWKDGLTGYPIVDAGMRQLKALGWMHNRVRMIVASFLTKDLHVHWQLGEKYFMEMLIDGDLALNNMGWQWAASTGCDAQPYFRIFNPYLQGKKFDPNAAYIKAFVPELRSLSAKDIHNLTDKVRPRAYPRPIVDHNEERFVALSLYKAKAKKT
jgi:deoxyribodipyrimidine photo-lyase